MSASVGQGAERLRLARRVVVKVGSALLVDAATGRLNRDWLAALAEDLAVMRRAGQELVVVSSGAIALGRSDGDGTEAVTAAISALDRAAEKGIIHRNNAARRKSRLMAKANAAHLLDGAQAEAGPKKRSAATKRSAIASGRVRCKSLGSRKRRVASRS